MSQPQLTISGYRGIWGESLTPDIAQRYVRAYISFVKNDIDANPIILIGRDGRESGTELKNAIISELKKLGVSYIDGDILPTPTVLFSVRKHEYDGAIIITASHNPIEYNGLKFVTDKALFIDENDLEKIKKYYEDDIIVKNTIEGKEITPVPNFPQEHADHIIAHINADAIKKRKFKIAVDMINASACVLDPYLFKQLDVEFIAINDIPNGKFTHKPEPLIENLAEISQLVKESHVDVGFVHDPDADRLVFIDENGNIVSEEHTVAICVEQVLSKNPDQAVVINMSTSQMSVDIAEKYNGQCIRTKVGEAHVVRGIFENTAIIGGEGGGGCIYPTINTARDSFVTLSLILELLAERGQTTSGAVASLPQYVMKKDKVSVSGNMEDMYQKMKSHFKDTYINELDGLRLDFSDSSWVHLRPSNTEPIIRLFGEAKTADRINSLFDEVKSLFSI